MIELKPIRTRAEHTAALKEIERLWSSKPKTADGDRLDVLATLVERYEEAHFKIDPPDPVAAIEFRMEQEGLTRNDLVEVIGSRGRVSEVMNRKRGLSIEMIRRLNEEWGISAEVLIQPTVAEEGRFFRKVSARAPDSLMVRGRDKGRLAARRTGRLVAKRK